MQLCRQTRFLREGDCVFSSPMEEAHSLDAIGRFAWEFSFQGGGDGYRHFLDLFGECLLFDFDVNDAYVGRSQQPSDGLGEAWFGTKFCCKSE